MFWVFAADHCGIFDTSYETGYDWGSTKYGVFSIREIQSELRKSDFEPLDKTVFCEENEKKLEDLSSDLFLLNKTRKCYSNHGPYDDDVISMDYMNIFMYDLKSKVHKLIYPSSSSSIPTKSQ